MILVLVWLAFAVVAWSFVGSYLAPDACLDQGGSFNYSSWACSHSENSAFVSVPIFKVPGFWPAFIGFCVAVAVSFLPGPTSRSRNDARETARAS